MVVYGDYFNGNEISKYGREQGYVDYRTLAKGYNAVLNNNIIEVFDFYPIRISDGEVMQYYIVDSAFADVLEEIGETLYYSDDLDMYLWGVTHYGTAWDYVLTNIKIERRN